METKKIFGWDVKHLRTGGLMDQGLRIHLELVGQEGDERTIFLSCQEANTTVKLIVALLKSARDQREAFGLEKAFATEELQNQQLRIRKTVTAAHEGGQAFAIRFETEDGPTYTFAMDRLAAQSLAEGLVAVLSKYGVPVDLDRSAGPKH